MFRRLIFILGLCGIGMPGYCEIQQVSTEKLNEMITQRAALAIVDVRSGYDFQKGHIPGAMNAPYNAIDKANLPKEGTLVLYCGNDKCPLSHLAAKTLEGAGYKNAAVLADGFAGWTAKGYSVETSAGVAPKKAVVKISAVPPAKLRKRLADKALGILDIRPAKEFVIAHLPGAKNIPLEGLGSGSDALSKDLEWIVYGRQGENVNSAAQLLAAKGFKVKELSGGIQVWAAKKYPLVTGEAK